MPVHRIRRECPFSALGCSPWCRGRALPPFKRRLLGQFIGAGGHEVRLTSTAGSQHSDLSIAQSNLHPGLRLRTRHRACDAYGAPIRRHESIGNGELRLGQPRIDTATNHVQCSRPHTFDVLRQVQPRPACRWALASRWLHRKGVRVTAWAAMAVLAVVTVAASLVAGLLGPAAIVIYAPGPQPTRLARRPPPPPQPIRPVKALSNGHRGRVRTSSDARDHRQQ